MEGHRTAGTERAAVVCRVDDGCDDLDLKLSRAWLRIAIAGVFAGQGMVFSFALNLTPPPFGSLPYWILHGGLIFSSLVVMAFLGGPLFASTWSMLRRGRLSIEGLFTLSLAGAFVGSVVGSVTGEGDVFYEVVAIVIAIYTFGRMLGERSQAKLLSETESLRTRFDRAVVQTPNGDWEERPVSDVRIGDRVRVEPGQAFSLDGIVCSGVGYVEETALTGEPLPVVRRKGDWVKAGTWARDARFEIEVKAVSGQRELDRILDDLELGKGTPSELQTQANRLVARFLPVVVAVSLLTALYWAVFGTWVEAALNSMAVLLVACPCALGLATPVALSQGLFRLAQMGIVSRNGSLVDALARTKCVFFDKTGTLSESRLRVSEFWMDPAFEVKRSALLGAILHSEQRLEHPVGRSLVYYLKANGFVENGDVESLKLNPGRGIELSMRFGNEPSVVSVGELTSEVSSDSVEFAVSQLHDPKGKHVYVCVDGLVRACFVLKEVLREGVDTLLRHLDALNVSVEVATGDPDPKVLDETSIPIHSGQSAEEKTRRVLEASQADRYPLFVGDGINDATAMAAAAGSISMGSGTGLARSVAMGQLNGDRIEVIPDAIRLARSIHIRLRGNLLYAAVYNVIGMLLAAVGLLHPIVAALIMLISSFAVTVRSLRQFKL